VLPVGRDLVPLQAVRDVRHHPGLHAAVDRVEEVDERDARAVPVHLEGGLDRGVARAHDQDVLVVVGIGLVVVVAHLVELLAGHLEHVRAVESARGHDHGVGIVHVLGAVARRVWTR
jgi:hypothetical protein